MFSNNASTMTRGNNTQRPLDLDNDCCCCRCVGDRTTDAQLGGSTDGGGCYLIIIIIIFNRVAKHNMHVAVGLDTLDDWYLYIYIG